MKNSLSAIKSRYNVAKFALWSFLVTGVSDVYAALPTTADPSEAPADGNYIELIQGYAFDVLIVIGLILATIAFIAVSKNMVGVYSEIGAGKKTWGDMGMHGGMGVLLLVFVVYLLTEASTIIFAA